MKTYPQYLFILVGILCLQSAGLAQDAAYRPGLFFREDWKEIPAEIPLHQGHVNHPDLMVALYGPGKDSLKKSHNDAPADDPFYIWSGLCLGNWAVTLRQAELQVNLTGPSKIMWRSKQSGFRELHVLLKLQDGTWLVSRQGDGPSEDWRIKEFNVPDLEWYSFDIHTITEGKRVQNPDLSRVAEIGFTDLMPGGMSDACSRLDWIEVYGYLVRPTKTTTTN
ncbi:MAG: hypothetical protein E4H10_02415 [Bacteroidia bacterium]|nr:MAG: hypothetical protein E4H10_02415 [Bacteroidia bacterium]